MAFSISELLGSAAAELLTGRREGAFLGNGFWDHRRESQARGYDSASVS
jgi:hypothetical protein